MMSDVSRQHSGLETSVIIQYSQWRGVAPQPKGDLNCTAAKP